MARASSQADVLFDVLADEHRRQLLLSLLGDESCSTSWGRAVPPADGDETNDRQLLMRHAHLPKLEDAGYVRLNGDGRRIEAGPNFETIQPLLELLDANRGLFPRID